MKYKHIKIIILLQVISFFASCEYAIGEKGVFSMPAETPPFVITRPVCETRERQPYFNYAGIVFKFMNTGNKIIDEITVSFMLYDSITKENPFVGSNKFSIKKLDLIPPDDNKEVIISLDHYIYFAPQTPYLIDFFYISEIHFTDDSIWEDKYGLYKIE